MFEALVLDQAPYAEPLRPQFHFTAKTGWLNDPNGLVFANGEYHLFFQHNPLGTQWGNMTWGHAVSKDLVRWRQLADALTPDALGTMFSGSAVLDEHATAGLGRGIVLIYTAAGGTSAASSGKRFTQCLAFSPDGRTFHKLAANPILPHIVDENRDPKVIWHAPSKRWIMALYLTGDRFALFSSTNLREWKELHEVRIPGAGECPDFFELPIDGDAKRKVWVFWAANGRYRLGRFDGAKFTATTEPIPTNFGNTGYAAQTYFNDPKGRRVQIAWLNGSEFPNCPWNQQMGFPTKMSLRTTPEGPRLAFEPIDEIRSLRVRRVDAHEGVWSVPSGLIDFSGEWTPPATGRLELTINGVTLVIDAQRRTIEALGKHATIPAGDNIRLRVLADRASLEVFAQRGLVSMPLFHISPPAANGVSLHTTGDWHGKTEVWDLKSAW